jgi:hypothetical protein
LLGDNIISQYRNYNTQYEGDTTVHPLRYERLDRTGSAKTPSQR